MPLSLFHVFSIIKKKNEWKNENSFSFPRSNDIEWDLGKRIMYLLGLWDYEIYVNVLMIQQDPANAGEVQ